MCNARAENLNHVLALCSSTKVIAAYLYRWVDWWTIRETSVTGIWSAIEALAGTSTQKDVRRLIAAAYLWTIWNHRNAKAFQGAWKKEKEIGEEIQFLAYLWITSRSKMGKSISWVSWVHNPVMAVSSCISLAPR